MNSSSLIIDSAILFVCMASGELWNKWAKICSAILSLFCWDIFGMMNDRFRDIKVIRFYYI